MKQLWEWTATDQFGEPRTYQAEGHDVTEATMLEHLRVHFRNATITGLKRLKDGERKPPAGPIRPHLYTFGILEKVRREMGQHRTQSLIDKIGTTRIQRAEIPRVEIPRAAI